jgi:cation transport ATPase
LKPAYTPSMKKLAIFLITVLILSSCGTGSTFSKRKHLPGHFWNKTEKYKTEKEAKIDHKDKGDFVQNELKKSSRSYDEGKSIEENLLHTEGQTEVSEEESENVSNLIQENELSEDQNLSDAEFSETEIQEEVSEANNESYQSKSNENRDPFAGLAAFVIFAIAMIVSFFVGLILLIIWLILNASGTIGMGMLITSLFMIGIPLLLLLIFAIIVGAN